MQAPHCSSPQPKRLPRSPSPLRRTSSSGAVSSASISTARPFTSSRKLMSGRAASLRRFTQRARIDGVAELRTLPLRSEQALLHGAGVRRAHLVAGGAQIADAVEAQLDDAE